MGGVSRILTLDGPAGSGKSTVARALAKALDAVFFSTGAIYRAVTFLALQAGLKLDEPGSAGAVLDWLDRTSVDMTVVEGEIRVLLDGTDPGAALRDPRVTENIHWVADDPSIRERLRLWQRDVVRRVGGVVVAEGRDLGTVVFPNAGFKVFLSATLDQRARRRGRERQIDAGEAVDLDRVRAELLRRDRFDQERADSPLVAAPDAWVVDTTDLTADEVVSAIQKGLPREWVQDALE